MFMEYRLYIEILFVALLLLLILLVNNIFLYKQKIKNRVSLMLIIGIFMSVFEIIWGICNGQENLFVLTYISTACYCISFIIFSAFLNRYLIESFGIRLNKIAVLIIYIIPVSIFILLCIITPWTRWVFFVDKSGTVQEMILFGTMFQGMLYAYFFTPLLLTVYYLTIGRRKRKKLPASIFVFGIAVPVLYFLELFIIGGIESDYQTMSLPVSLALVYLITNMSTHTVLETRANMEAVETDLRIASKIQTDALPPVSPEFAQKFDLKLYGSMNTAKEVGGDFYDYFPIDDNRMCFLIADVSGKGTPAALFMMTAKTMIKDYALTKNSTSEIFNEVNVRLCENNEAGMFATAWIGILDIRTMTLQYTNAGHNYPIIQRKGQPCELMETVHGLFLAGLEFTEYKQDEIKLNPGDRLLLYTDGVTEAHDKDNSLYGTERLEKVLEENRDTSGEQVLSCILDDINLFAQGMPQFDDITMVILNIKE